eukprot:13810191-Heterocapsa_arctica.AAC.1
MDPTVVDPARQDVVAVLPQDEDGAPVLDGGDVEIGLVLLVLTNPQEIAGLATSLISSSSSSSSSS